MSIKAIVKLLFTTAMFFVISALASTFSAKAHAKAYVSAKFINESVVSDVSISFSVKNSNTTIHTATISVPAKGSIDVGPIKDSENLPPYLISWEAVKAGTTKSCGKGDTPLKFLDITDGGDGLYGGIIIRSQCDEGAFVVVRFTNQGNSETARVDFKIVNDSGKGQTIFTDVVHVGANNTVDLGPYSDRFDNPNYIVSWTAMKDEGPDQRDGGTCEDPDTTAAFLGRTDDTGAGVYNATIPFSCWDPRKPSPGPGPKPTPSCTFKESVCEGSCGGKYYDIYDCSGREDKRNYDGAYDYICNQPPYCPVPTAAPTSPPTSPAPTSPPSVTLAPTSPPGVTLSPAPTSKPTVTPTLSPSPTSPPSSKPTPSPTSPPSATLAPTPLPFSSSMCKCDGMESTPIIAGQKVTFSAFGKVEGANINSARVSAMKFSVGKGNDIRNVTLIGQSDYVLTQEVSRSPSKVRYKSSWDFTMPGNIEKGTIYHVWSDLKCERKTAIQGARTFDPFSILQKLFGIPAREQSTGVLGVSDRKSLQLTPIQFGDVLEKSCKLIRFQFNQ